MDTRAIHVEGLTMVSMPGEETIPKIMQITNFEERLRDIGEAIGFGEKNTGKNKFEGGITGYFETCTVSGRG